MATPLQNIVRYSTRSHSGGLLNSLTEPEKVYRRRLNRLAPLRLLPTLGEEAISDIHLLFAQNNQSSPMDDLCKPCDFSNITSYPHALPNKAIEKLPSFQGNNAISAKSHTTKFNQCIAKWCNASNYVDVRMRLFVLSSEDDAMEWFEEQNDNKFKTLKEIIEAFNDR